MELGGAWRLSLMRFASATDEMFEVAAAGLGAESLAAIAMHGKVLHERLSPRSGGRPMRSGSRGSACDIAGGRWLLTSHLPTGLLIMGGAGGALMYM